MGLDERSRNPLHHLGVGHGRAVLSQWRYSHNYRHHMFTNVVGVDDDLGYGVMRVTRDQPWRPSNLLQPLRHLLLALTFEWGIALHGLYSEQDRAGTDAEKSAHTRALRRKIARQAGKDFLLFPAFAGRRWRRVLFGNVLANLLRNLWAYAVICCGHFVDGAEKFTPEALEDETKAQWYLRQMLGSANFRAGPVMALMSGNLCYQIEHHLYLICLVTATPQIAERVREVCVKYELPYTTGPLARQYLLVLRTIAKLALPDRFLAASSDDAPETASEKEISRRRQTTGSSRRWKPCCTSPRTGHGDPQPQQPAQPTTNVGAAASRCECSITAPRQSGLVESREKHFLSQELQGGCDRDGNENSD